MKATKFSLMAVIALGSVMVLAPITRAQEEKDDDAKPKAPPRERGLRAQDQVKRIAEELKLTDEQKTKFEAVMKEEREKQAELRQVPQEERVAKVREMRADTTAKMKAILDAEQFEKWQKMRQAGPRARGARGEKPAGEKPSGDKAPDGKTSDDKVSGDKTSSDK